MAKRDDSMGLAQAALAVRARGAGEYDAFVAALRTLHATAVAAVVASPIENVQVMQGRARGMADLLAILEAPDATVRKLESTST